SKSFIIFLSNRNHPDEHGNVIGLRAKLGTLAAEAITDFNFASVAGALPRTDEQGGRITPHGQKKTLNGIDVLKREKFARLKGLRVGLITNHPGVDGERNSPIDLLKNAPDVQLTALFTPDHGIRGMMDEKVADSTDEKTGLPVYSLYGLRHAPTAEEMKNL